MQDYLQRIAACGVKSAMVEELRCDQFLSGVVHILGELSREGQPPPFLGSAIFCLVIWRSENAQLAMRSAHGKTDVSSFDHRSGTFA